MLEKESNGVNYTICAIIPVYNAGSDIHKSLDGIYNQVNEVILVDDGSDKETLNVLKTLEKNKKVSIIYNEINLGISVALNKGVEYALSKKYDWVLTLDQDSIVCPNMISTMLITYENITEKLKNKVIMVVPRIMESAFDNKNSFEHDCCDDTYEFLRMEITSGNLIKAEAFNKVGKYNEKFFIDFVDNEFCLRIKKLDYFIIRANNSVMFHRIGNSKRHKFLFIPCICTNHNYSRRYYITRNRFYTWHDYFNVNRIWVLKDIRSFIGEIVKIILWEDDKLLKIKMIKKGICDYRKNIYGKLG